MSTGKNSNSSDSVSGGVTISPFFASGDNNQPPSSPTRGNTSVCNPDENTNTSGEGDSSIFGAGFNFINSIVGAGIIGIPIAIKECGLFFGIFLVIFVAILINHSTIMIIECGIVAKKLNLEELCRHLFGVHGYNVCALSMFVFAYGAMIAYTIIIGDTVPIALNFFIGEDAPGRTAVMLISGCCIILPLSMLRDMSSLSSTSLISIAADFFMVLFICIRAKHAADKENTEFEAPADVTVISGATIAEGLGTISFAFVCQHSSFLVYRSMREGTLNNWKKVSNASLTIAGVMCLLLGLVGYLAFGDFTEADIMNNFPADGE